jgi:hypothetical protein
MTPEEEALIQFLMQQYGFTPEEAFMVAAQAGGINPDAYGSHIYDEATMGGEGSFGAGFQNPGIGDTIVSPMDTPAPLRDGPTSALNAFTTAPWSTASTDAFADTGTPPYPADWGLDYWQDMLGSQPPSLGPGIPTWTAMMTPQMPERQQGMDIPDDLDSLIMEEILSRLINPAGNVLPEQANAHRGMAASRAAQGRNRGGASQDIIQRLMGDAQQGDKNRQRAGQDYRFAADTARRGDAVASLAPPPLVANPTSDLGALLQGVQTGSAPANPVSIDPLSVDQTGFSPASGFPHYGPGPMRAAGLNLGQSGLLNTVSPTMEPGLGNAGLSTQGDGYTGMPILDALQNWFQGHRPIPHPGSPPIDRTPGPSKTTQQGPSKTTQQGNSGTTTSRPGRSTAATQRQSTPRPAPAPTPAPSRGTATRSFTAPPPATPKSTVPTGVGRSRR